MFNYFREYIIHFYIYCYCLFFRIYGFFFHIRKINTINNDNIINISLPRFYLTKLLKGFYDYKTDLVEYEFNNGKTTAKKIIKTTSLFDSTKQLYFNNKLSIPFMGKILRIEVNEFNILCDLILYLNQNNLLFDYLEFHKKKRKLNDIKVMIIAIGNKYELDIHQYYTDTVDNFLLKISNKQ